jgi:hypothetical protein
MQQCQAAVLHGTFWTGQSHGAPHPGQLQASLLHGTLQFARIMCYVSVYIVALLFSTLAGTAKGPFLSVLVMLAVDIAGLPARFAMFKVDIAVLFPKGWSAGQAALSMFKCCLAQVLPSPFAWAHLDQVFNPY